MRPAGTCQVWPGVAAWGEGFVTGGSADAIQPSPYYRTWGSECAQDCADDPSCKSFVFDGASRSCHRHSSEYKGSSVDLDAVSGSCNSAPLPAQPPPPTPTGKQLVVSDPALPRHRIISWRVCASLHGGEQLQDVLVPHGNVDLLQAFHRENRARH